MTIINDKDNLGTKSAKLSLEVFFNHIDIKKFTIIVFFV